MLSKFIPRIFLGLLFSLSFLFATNLAQLANDPTWQALLFYDPHEKKSEIVDPSYFLAPRSFWSPLQELKATIKAYYRPIPKNPNDHPRCRFPARYYWLNKKVDLKDYSVIPPFCKDLKKSFSQNHIKSVSLIFASSYLGNPASSFGHTFIKLNKKIEGTDLLDFSINYGAIIPKHENIFRYVFYGLAGFYKAQFKDKYFYTQDFVYSNMEMRTLWEYELNLDDEELLFYLLHVWEFSHKDFKYLFLSKNCGYEVLRSLQIVLPKKIKRPFLWYAPKENLYYLASLDPNKIASIKLHEASDKIVYRTYQKLPKKLRHLITTYLPNDLDALLEQNLSIDQSQKLLDFLLSYYNYKALKHRKKYDEQKYKILKKRLFLPPKKSEPIPIPKKIPPHLTSPMSQIYGGYESSNKAFLGYTTYRSTPLTYNDSIDHGVELFSFKLFRHSLEATLFDVEQFDTYTLPFEDEFRFSWKLAVGYNDGFYATLGLGKTLYHKDDRFLLYMLPYLHLSSDSRADLEFGAIFNLDRLRLRLRIDRKHSAKIESRFFFTKSFALFAKAQKNSATMALEYYF